jgi:glutamate synthase (NADPH/NADH) large chain
MGVRSLPNSSVTPSTLEILPGETSKQRKLDLAPLAGELGLVSDKPQYCVDPRNEPFDKGVLAEKWCATCRMPSPKNRRQFSYEVRNFHRSIGARLSGEIAKRWGNTA